MICFQSKKLRHENGVEQCGETDAILTDDFEHDDNHESVYEIEILDDSLAEMKTNQPDMSESVTADDRQILCCEYCGEVVSSKRALTIHCRRHIGAAPKPCVQCVK